MIRLASAGDLESVNRLLRQVLKVHHDGRPDLFREVGKKYTDDELLSLFEDPDTPVFVYEEEESVLGYAFCALVHQDSGSLMPLTTLYIDDLCVDESARGRHIGTALFDYVKAFAREKGCHNITLHAWECNPSALSFYRTLGLTPQYTSLELRLSQ
jgi:ribosomal protein S18 acetylase RimI-like enzyme